MDKQKQMMAVVEYLSDEVPSNGLTTETQSQAFLRFALGGQRLGQALMNVLHEPEYNKLTGSLFDPFHRDDAQSCINALEWVTS